MIISALPPPIHAPAIPDEEETVLRPSASTSTPPPVVPRQAAPPYGQRNGWKPISPEDYGACRLDLVWTFLTSPFQGDGGAFPECHIAQYPLDMGKKKVCLSKSMPPVPPHSVKGFLGQHTSSSSGQRRQRSL